ncbi:cation transporter [Tabrizicola oligotrophica]|uniref:Cation transporter n=1 Tax=Tabrizicola oligotrophica TaxID=2710650 RepID=A0A6M0QTI4_9RHOB|nr:cation transporter [Tabrizicola oligotrophica]NEY90776.1 cation transporter [Tabrizicola oligotrophica]
MTEQRFTVSGMDCGSCLAKLEAAAQSVAGVTAARASLVTGELVVTGRFDTAALVQAITATGHGIAPPTVSPERGYRRMLALVVVLNLGYGAVETLAGFLAGSQALLADALDFWGDGLISGLALLALGWSAAARARVALAQGVFLAVMGLGVLAMTLREFAAARPPDEAIMGWAGAGALAVNLICAALLMRHRSGDASARAVWLFSRNDALSNLAVVLAAGLVALTGSALPDLLTALAIAGLFLWSGRIILRDALAELR